MRVTVFGGSGRIGQIAVRRAQEAGFDVTAFSGRNLEVPGITNVVGDIQDPEAVRHALSRAEAIIAAVGPRSNTPESELILERGMQVVIEAARASGIDRLVTLSGAGVDVPGDDKPFLDRLASEVVRRAARHVVGGKQREFEVLAASDLAWTALRPPLVIDGSPRGYTLSLRLRPGARVTREDVGQALVDQLRDRTHLRQAPFVLPATQEASDHVGRAG